MLCCFCELWPNQLCGHAIKRILAKMNSCQKLDDTLVTFLLSDTCICTTGNNTYVNNS